MNRLFIQKFSGRFNIVISGTRSDLGLRTDSKWNGMEWASMNIFVSHLNRLGNFQQRTSIMEEALNNQLDKIKTQSTISVKFHFSYPNTVQALQAFE